MFYRATSPHSRTQRLRRARAVIALGAVAFAIGAIVGAAGGGSSANALAGRFVSAWVKADYASMYSDIDAVSRQSTSAGEFAEAYESALTTATATRVLVTGKPRRVSGGLIAVPVRVHTRLFGTLNLSFSLPVVPGSEGDVITWSRSLTFPGLHQGEVLSRRTNLPRRATLLARDGSVLAETSAGSGEGAARVSPLGAAASALLGGVGPLPSAHRRQLEAEGVPAEATVGTSGLELALDNRLRGAPGGELLAKGSEGEERVLAATAPRPASAVRSTISPAIQTAAVTALGGQYGGIVALAPSTGQILAVAGIGVNSVQPPGSTFKMVTVTGVLQAGIATPHTVYPYSTFATLDGVKLSNSNGEECGGSLELAFAVSCNSVFAPLGVKLGASRLVATAESYGFNHEPSIPGAAESTLPPAAQIQGELDLGSTAIGQGQVQASPLEMATIAATIADAGRRPSPTFTISPYPSPGVPATSAAVARTVRHLMIGVVRFGTGTAAAIPHVTVAGKTGTAELKSECTTPASKSTGETGSTEAGKEAAGGCQAGTSEAANTDAWFAAFAPALHPRIAVAVLLVKDGAGGSTAAPVARQVLEAGLSALHG